MTGDPTAGATLARTPVGRPVIAVVDAYSTGRFLAAELSRRGGTVLHVQSTPEVPPHLRAAGAEGFAASVVHNGDPELVAEWLRGHGVTHVLPGAETGVRLAHELGVRLGLPRHGAAAAAAHRNKWLMAQRVATAGLAVPDSAVISRPEQLTSWMSAHPRRPVVLKPLASAGGDNVWICPDAEAALAALDRIVTSRNVVGQLNLQALVQEFQAGEEVFANTVSWAGRHHVAEVWRYVKRRLPDGPVIYDFEQPLPPEDDRVPLIADFVRGVLEALQIRHGAAHTEVMLTGRGPVLVETGARLAGSVLPDVVRRCFGTSQLDLLAGAVTDPDGFAALAGRPFRLAGTLRYVWLVCPRDGLRVDPTGLRRLHSLPTVAAVTVPSPALPLPRTVDSASCPGQVYLFGPADDVERDHERLRQLEEGGLYVP